MIFRDFQDGIVPSLVCQKNDKNLRISSETGLPHDDNISLSLCLILHLLLQFVIIKQVCLPLKYG